MEVVPFPFGPCLAISNPSGTCRWPPAPRHRQLVPSELWTLQGQQPREALAPTVSTYGPAGQRCTCCLWGWRRWHVQSHGKGGLGARAGSTQRGQSWCLVCPGPGQPFLRGVPLVVPVLRNVGSGSSPSPRDMAVSASEGGGREASGSCEFPPSLLMGSS